MAMTELRKIQATLERQNGRDLVGIQIGIGQYLLTQKQAESLLYNLHDCVESMRGYQKRPSLIKRILRRS